MQRPAYRRATARGTAVVFGVRVAPVRLSTADLLFYQADETPAVPAGRPLLAVLQPVFDALGAGLALFTGRRQRSRRQDTLR